MAMDWNYYDTFITIAPDCPAARGVKPPDKKTGPTKAGIEYELIASRPYGYTQEELLYQVHIRHKGITPEELEARDTQLRDEFYGKPKACMRASMLPKKYGWGIHFNEAGYMALVSADSPEYEQFLAGAGSARPKVLAAMRNSRK